MAAATAAGMLVEERGAVRFTHDLYRETIADLVPAPDRPALHRSVADALEQRLARGAAVPAAELAGHHRAALPSAGTGPAVTWALRAAAEDLAALALAEAAAHLRRLRAAVAAAGTELPDDALVDVLLAEADALARAGRPSDARGLLQVAREAADRSGDPVRVTRAALAAVQLGSRFASRRDDVVAELESALAAVSGTGPALEAQLSAALARELQHSVPEQRAWAGPLSERALRAGPGVGRPRRAGRRPAGPARRALDPR